MKTYNYLIVLVAVGLVCTSITTKATLNNFGPIVQPPPQALSPLQSFSSPFSIGSFSGFLNSWVVPNNPVASGLGFSGNTYVFQANADGPDVMQSIAINGFAGLNLGISYNPQGGAFDPSNISQAANPSQTININFGPGYVGPGDYIYIYTQTTSPGTLVYDSVINSLPYTVQGLAPVPEPSTLALAALGGVTALMIIRRPKAVISKT